MSPLKLSRKEAAQFLSVSEKSISRYVESGKLVAGIAANKPGRQLEFDRADLERLLAETGQGERAIVSHVPAPIERDPTLDNGALADLIRLIVTETGHARQDAPLVPLVDKMMLTMDEAAALSGVAKSALLQARASGHLHAVKIGRGYKVRRADLAKFVDALFVEKGK